MPPAISSRLHTYHHLALPSNYPPTISINVPTFQSPKSSNSNSSNNGFHNHNTSPLSKSKSKTRTSNSSLTREQRLLESFAPLPANASIKERQSSNHRKIHRINITEALGESLESALSESLLEPMQSLTLIKVNFVSSLAFQSLLTGLSSHSASLKSFSLIQCKGVDWELLTKSLATTFSSLISLSLAQTKMENINEIQIHRIVSLPLLTSFNLSSTKINHQNLLIVTNSLNESGKSNIRHLDVSNNEANFNVAQSLAAALKFNQTLNSLNAQFNNFTIQGIVEIAASLASNTVLSALDLRWNGLNGVNVSQVNEKLISSLTNNQSLLELLLCGPVEPISASLQSSLQLIIARNRSRMTEDNENTGNPRSSISSQMTEFANPLLNLNGINRKDGFNVNINNHQSIMPSPSPLPSYRSSYSESLGSSSPSLLTPYFIDESPKPFLINKNSSLQSQMSSSAPGPLPIINSSSSSSSSSSSQLINSEGKLSSVVLAQEQEIARQGAVIARLMKLCQNNKNEKEIKTKSSRKKNPQETNNTTNNNTETNNNKNNNNVSPNASPPTRSMSPPIPLPRPSFSLDHSTRNSILQAASENINKSANANNNSNHNNNDKPDVSEIPRNLDLAATIVLLESEKDQQAREVVALKSELSRRQTQEEKEIYHDDDIDDISNDKLNNNNPIIINTEQLDLIDLTKRRSLFDDRARLIKEISELRQALSSSLPNTNIAPSAAKSKRDSISSVLLEQRTEFEIKLSEKDEKIQSLLSAQRVLAESREAKHSALIREWREKESYFNFEFQRLKEENIRLKLRVKREGEKVIIQNIHNSNNNNNSQKGDTIIGINIIHDNSDITNNNNPNENMTNDSDSDSDESETESSLIGFTIHPSNSASPALNSTTATTSSDTLPFPSSLPVSVPHRLGHVVAERIAALSHSATRDTPPVILTRTKKNFNHNHNNNQEETKQEE